MRRDISEVGEKRELLEGKMEEGRRDVLEIRAQVERAVDERSKVLGQLLTVQEELG